MYIAYRLMSTSITILYRGPQGLEMRLLERAHRLFAMA